MITKYRYGGNRLKSIFLVLILLTSCKCVNTEVNLFKKNINDCDIVIIGKSSVLRRTYSPVELIRIRFNEIEYYVGVNESENIQYALTWDSNFISPDNVKVGDTFKKIKSISKYYAYYSDNHEYILNSGWHVVIKFGGQHKFDGQYEENIPDDTSRVVWFERIVKK